VEQIFSLTNALHIFFSSVRSSRELLLRRLTHVLTLQVKVTTSLCHAMLLSVRRPNIAFNDGNENHSNAMFVLMNSVIPLTTMSASCHSLSDKLGLRGLTPCPRPFQINSNDYDLCHKIESILNLKKKECPFFNDSSLIFDFVALC
jgi:hypothetical protein